MVYWRIILAPLVAGLLPLLTSQPVLLHLVYFLFPDSWFFVAGYGLGFLLGYVLPQVLAAWILGSGRAAKMVSGPVLVALAIDCFVGNMVEWHPLKHLFSFGPVLVIFVGASFGYVLEESRGLWRGLAVGTSAAVVAVWWNSLPFPAVRHIADGLGPASALLWLALGLTFRNVLVARWDKHESERS